MDRKKVHTGHDTQAKLSERSILPLGSNGSEVKGTEVSESGVPSNYETATRGGYYETEVLNYGAYQPKYDKKNRIASALRAADTARHRRTKSKGGTAERLPQLKPFPTYKEMENGRVDSDKPSLTTPTFGASSTVLLSGSTSPIFGDERTSQRRYGLLPTPPTTPRSPPPFRDSRFEVRTSEDGRILLKVGDINLALGDLGMEATLDNSVSELDLRIIQFFRGRVHNALEARDWVTAEGILHEFVAKLENVLGWELGQKYMPKELVSWSIVLASVRYERRNFEGALQTLDAISTNEADIGDLVDLLRARLLLILKRDLNTAKSLCLKYLLDEHKRGLSGIESTSLMASILEAMGKNVEADFYRSMLEERARSSIGKAKVRKLNDGHKSPMAKKILPPASRGDKGFNKSLDAGIEKLFIGTNAAESADPKITKGSRDSEKQPIFKKRPRASFRSHLQPSSAGTSTATASFPDFPTEKTIGDLLRPFDLKIKHLLCLDGSIIRVIGQENDISNACEAALKKDMSVQDFYKDENGANSLILAARNNHVYALQMLLHDGRLEIDATDNLNQTALFHASRNGYREAVEALIESGANVNHIVRNPGKIDSPLISAAASDHYQVVELLLENGAGLSCASESVKRALHGAVAQKSSKVAKILRQHGLETKAGFGRRDLAG